jgi:hypothetical protein
MPEQSLAPITYADSNRIQAFEFRPGSKWKILFEDPQTGQRAILVEWEAGYAMSRVDHHECDEIVFVLSGTFVQEGRASGPGTYIHHCAGSSHLASTPDGCKFLEVVSGHGPRKGEVTSAQIELFRKLVTCKL